MTFGCVDSFEHEVAHDVVVFGVGVDGGAYYHFGGTELEFFAVQGAVFVSDLEDGLVGAVVEVHFIQEFTVLNFDASNFNVVRKFKSFQRSVFMTHFLVHVYFGKEIRGEAARKSEAHFINEALVVISERVIDFTKTIANQLGVVELGQFLLGGAAIWSRA